MSVQMQIRINLFVKKATYRRCLLMLVSGLFITQFVLAQAPVITAFSPQSGTTGSTVTITGSNFSTVAANNIVRFGSVKAVVQSASANTIVVTVPIGATFKPLTVTTNNLTAYAAKPFLVTFPGGDSGFSPNSFLPGVDSATGKGAAAVATADLDDDGRTDMAVVNMYNNLLSVYRNTSSIGALSFQSKTNYTIGDTSMALTTADLDGDGKLEIITANWAGNTISVFRNGSTPGSISFLPKTDLAAGSHPVAVAVADLDGDGKPDLAVVNYGSNTVSVFRNISTVGSIALAAGVNITTGNAPTGVTVTDIDGDAKPDVAVTNGSDNTVSVFKNISTAGTIGFNTKTDFPAFQHPGSIAAGDFDGDNLTDLAVVSGSNTTISVLKNQSNSGVFSFASPATYLIRSLSIDLSVSDMDGDGRPDLVAINYSNASVSVLKNACTPGTILFNAKNDYTIGTNPFGVSVADMDGDSKPDILSANVAGSVTVLRNTVTLPFINSFTPATAGNGSIVTISGINFTGVTEVSFGDKKATSFTIDSVTGITAIVDTGSTGSVKVVTNHGTATKTGFTYSKQPTISSFTPVTGGAGTVVTITGTNFTNATDVAFGATPAVSFQVLSPTTIVALAGTVPAGSMPVLVVTPGGRATMNGFYAGPVIYSVTPGSGPVGSTITITGRHFSNNAADNIVYFGAVKATVTSADTATLQVTVPAGATWQPISVTTGALTAYSRQPFIVTFKGDHTAFTATSFVKTLDSTVGYFPLQVLLHDLNVDGRPDVIASDFTTGISVLKNTSDNVNVSFAAKADYNTYPYIGRTCVGDLDGDGKAEIVVLNKMDNQYNTYFSVLRNTSTTDISFDNKQDFYLDYEAEPVGGVIADFDGDGKPDLAIATYSYVAVFRNTSVPGNISFAPKINVYTLGYAAAIAAADLDGDGRVDLAVADNGLRLYRNISNGGSILFSTATVLQSGFSPGSLALGDLDNDGRIDIAVSHGGNNNVSVLQNTSTTGSFSFAPNINFPLGINPYNVAINDLDGDGKPDMAVTTTYNNQVRLFKNTSTNSGLSFSDFTLYGNVALNYEMRDIISGDIDGDGRPDLVTANPNSNNVSLFLNNIPGDGMASVSIRAMGATSFCQGDQVVLKTAATAGAGYQWFNNGTAINGATDSIYTAVASGTYTVQETVGVNTALSAGVVVTVNPRPPAPMISITNTPLCQGQNVLLIANSPDNNQWYLNNVVLPGITGNTFRANISAVYTVTTTSNGCVSLPSNGAVVNFSTLPGLTVTPAAAVFCAGDSARLTVNAGTGSGYQWNVNETTIPLATKAEYFAKAGGNYTVSVNTNGCSGTSSIVTVTQNAVPAKPVITVNGNTLVSSAGMGNQWFLEGVAIAGATSQVYKPTQSGNYTVTATENGCTGVASEKYSFTITGIIVIDNTQYIKLNPNPAVNWLTISFNINNVNTLNIGLVDIEGRNVGAWKYLRSGDRLNVSGLSHGIYLVKIYTDNKKVNYVLKMLKQ